ncbi:SRPBCC family protein [Reichenbachiella sp.]|uniref:SRPBCC family protein n=1 Tax=Reichenbachiella sp. TaxID=2184521 RepID=UPI003B5A16F3
MAFYQFYKAQVVDATREELWNFISSPANLKLITPDHMGFDITSSHGIDKMYEGMIISYSVSPLPGFKTEWVTEITHIRDKEFFVDEQRIGPYTMWHHQHILEEIDKVMVMKDIISYQPPFGFLGAIANHLLITKKLNEIFDYREKAIDDYFNAVNSTQMTLV